MNDNKIRFIVLSIFLLSAMGFFKYVEFLDEKKEQLKKTEHTKLAQTMQYEIKNFIAQKEKATTAIALSLVNHNHELITFIKKRHIPKDYFRPLIERFKEDTNYKNIWIQIVDKNMFSLYRSWDLQRGDKVAQTRQDIQNVLKRRKIITDINVDKYTLSIRALVPIVENGQVLGVLEVISHFNSIAQMLKEEGVQLVVLLEKQYKSVLKYPYTKHFIDDYYVANFDIDEDILPFLKRDIRQYLEKEYVVEDGSLITVYTIYSPQNKPLAYAFMFKNLTELSYAKLDFLIFKWMAFGVILLLVVVMLFDVYLFRRLKKQKMHYKNIINLSTNIVIVHDKQKIIEANKVFFELFSEYDSLDTFNDSHGCVSDFFVLEDGYIQKIMDGKIWIEYLVAHKKQQHKVKLFYKEKLYYFMVSASIIDDTDELYAIVFTDITAEEQYKHELEDKNLQDPLTLIGNRRCFIDSLEHSIATARRYKQPLSLIMCDIDFFKKINDTYGHDVGDEVLIAYTKLIANNLRENDIFCRIGGEEFMIILPHTTKAEASRVAEKLRKIVEEAHEILEITMSFGVSEYRDGEDQKKFLKRVDEAVYTSKENGRNRVSTN